MVAARFLLLLIFTKTQKILLILRNEISIIKTTIGSDEARWRLWRSTSIRLDYLVNHKQEENNDGFSGIGT